MDSLHILQARFWDSPNSLKSARFIIQRKYENMAHVLSRAYMYRRGRYEGQANTLHKSIVRIHQFSARISGCPDRPALLIHEAHATRAYWRGFATIAKCGNDWIRVHPHGEDIWNRALNIGYTMLARIIQERINSHGITSKIGILHAPRDEQDALVYDFQELFRQPCADAALLPLFSRHHNAEEITEKEIVSSVIKKLRSQTRYRYKFWRLSEIINQEIQHYVLCLRQNTLYIPYSHSWSHWVRQ